MSITEDWLLSLPDFDQLVLDFTAAAVEGYRSMPAMRHYSIDQGAFTITNTMLIMNFMQDGITSARLKAICKSTGHCSEGRTAALFAYMRARGHLVPHPEARGDRRVRKLVFSPDMIEYYRRRVCIGMTPFARFSDDIQAALGRMADDAFFQRYIGIHAFMSAVHFNPLSEETPNISFFAQRHTGTYLLYEMIGAGPGALNGEAVKLSVRRLSERLGVSRPHILKLLVEADAAGRLAWDRERREVRLPPHMIRSVRRLIAAACIFLIACASEAIKWAPDDRSETAFAPQAVSA